MKQLTLTIAFFLFGNFLTAQDCECLPEGINFVYQSEVDNFAENYPGCTKILGHLSFGSYDYNYGNYFGTVATTAPLSHITYIGGITVDDVGGGALDFPNLDTLGSLYWYWADFNSNISLEGLSNLKHIENVLHLEGSYYMTDINALENINSIGGSLLIANHYHTLTDITALNDVDISTITDLKIFENQQLAVCHIESVCNYLEAGGSHIIRDNAVGCNTPDEVANACGISPPCPLNSTVTLSTQEEIDDFGLNHSSCTQVPTIIIKESVGNSITNLNGLSQLSSIEGNLHIIDNTSLSSLSDLSNLVAISGNLYVSNNDALNDLNGLNNLTSIGGILNLTDNNALSSLTGLNNLTTTGSDLSIVRNNNLNDLTGLESLNSIGGFAYIAENVGLNTLNGLNNLTNIGNALSIVDNNVLTNLAALENLSTVSNFISITENDALNNLTGLSGLTSMNGDIFVTLNHALSNLTGLDNLASISENLNIYNNDLLSNLTGLNNLISVGGSLNLETNQNLNSLTGLENLTTVGGFLHIKNNDILIDFTGLENVTSVGFLRVLNNSTLSSFTGLENLVSIELDLAVANNPNLSDLTALENVTVIGRNLYLVNNNSLNSLSGLDNVDYTQIADLRLKDNANLSICNIQSICDYLENGGSSDIQNNAPDCNSAIEVEENCNSLPIEMLEPLQVRLDNKTAILAWRTATETNNSGFEIQRSKEGIEWERIAWQAGQGNASTSHSYSHIDQNPIFGTSYYRLKQVDFNGDAEYSNVVSLRYIRNGVTVYPNPVKAQLNLHTDYGTIQQIVIYDSNGKRITQIARPDNNIDVSVLSEGIYMIKITIDEEDFYKKIIVE